VASIALFLYKDATSVHRRFYCWWLASLVWCFGM